MDRRLMPALRVIWALAWPLEAQEAPSLEQLLSTPVSLASRRAQVLMDSPQAAEVITAEDIRASGAFRLTDVLKLATSLQVWEKDPTRTTVSLRGMNPNDNPRTLQVLVDGVPMFNFVAASLDWNALPVPVDAIERVEIVRGPSSSLWGANAQMGVIAITTRRAETGTGGSLRLGWASPGIARGQAWLSHGGDRFSLTAGWGGSATRDEDRTLPVITRPEVRIAQPTAARDRQVFLRPEWSDGPTRFWASLGFSEAGHFNEFAVHPALLRRILEFTDEATHRDLAQLGWAQAWRSDLSTQLTFNQKVFRLSPGPTRPIPGDATSAAAWAVTVARDPGLVEGYDFYYDRVREVALQVNWSPADHLNLVAGADAKRIETGANPTVGIVAERLGASGGYLSADESFGAWTLSLGARFANESLGGATTSPRVSILWGQGTDRVFRAGVFTSKRSPIVQEKLTAVNNATVAIVTSPNSDLKPERATAYELGFRATWPGASLDLTLFRIRLEDLIVQRLTGRLVGGKPEQQFTNNPKGVWDSGVELGLKAELSPETLLGFNAATCDFKDPLYDLDQQADFSPKRTASLWLRHRWGLWSGQASLQHTGSYTLATNLGGALAREALPARTSLHARVGVEPLRGLSVSLYGQNLGRPSTPTSLITVSNTLLVWEARRELGVQATWKF